MFNGQFVLVLWFGIFGNFKTCAFLEHFQWPTNAIFSCISSIHEYLRCRNLVRTVAPRQIKHIAWQALSSGIVKFNVDALALTNSGDLAIGGLCRDSNGYWLFGFIRKLDRCRILKDEVHAILNGLQVSWEFGSRSLRLESDSLLIVHKVTHGFHPKDPLFRELFICQEFLARN